MLTSYELLLLSEEVEKLYIDCTAELIVNISKHFKTGKNLDLQEWQIQKLGEMGKVTRESAEIIARQTGQTPEVVASVLEKAVGASLEEVEATLQAAAKAGKLAGASSDIYGSARVKAILENYTAQAVDKTNLVNTVMLNSVQMRYAAAIANVIAFEEAAKIDALMKVTNAAELSEKLGTVQGILNRAAGEVALATSTREEAMTRAIKKLADEGITGFIDAGGHHWSPEAYVSMDMRTTCNNVYVQAEKARSEDYGVNTFEISSKAAARPLCAPYQGKIYSWLQGDSGTIYDGNGVAHKYESIYSTSYGQPAGIFGINCGHQPYAFIDGYSFRTYKPLETDEEQKKNEERYQLTQQQRAMERNVRHYKTEALAQREAGNEAAAKAALQKAKESGKEYAIFCEKNNLTRRADRLSIYRK